MSSLLERCWTSTVNLGPLEAGTYAWRRAALKLGGTDAPFTLRSRYAAAPLWCRPNSSDVDVFDQIFRYREYRCLDDVADARFIVDCGANAGFSSAYLLNRFPNATVVAVEPDPGNFAALQRNLAPYHTRATAIHSGIWSSECGLVMSETPFRDGREWSRTVRPARDGETPLMYATDVGTLLQRSGHDRISVLKVDIEGSEVEMFRDGHCAWLDQVDTLVIELHGPECERVFHHAIASQNYSVSRCDELTVCQRLG